MATKQADIQVETPNASPDAPNPTQARTIVIWYRDLAPLVLRCVLQRMGKRDITTGLTEQQRIEEVIVLKPGRNEVDADLWEAGRKNNPTLIQKLQDLDVLHIQTKPSSSLVAHLNNMVASMEANQAPYTPHEIFMRWGSTSPQSAARNPLRIDMSGIEELHFGQSAHKSKRGALGSPILQG